MVTLLQCCTPCQEEEGGNSISQVVALHPAAAAGECGPLRLSSRGSVTDLHFSHKNTAACPGLRSHGTSRGARRGEETDIHVLVIKGNVIVTFQKQPCTRTGWKYVRCRPGNGPVHCNR